MRRPEGHPCLAATLDLVMAPLARLRPGVVGAATGRVLELGAGTGLNFGLYGPDTEVHAVEPDPHMRRRSAERAAAHDITVHAAAGESLPFPDAHFDAVVATFVFCTIPDVPTAIAELHRVLRPGGTLHLAEHVASSVGPFATLQHWIDPVWTRAAGGCHLDRDPVHDLLRGGFVDPQIRPRGSRWSILPVISGTLSR